MLRTSRKAALHCTTSKAECVFWLWTDLPSCGLVKYQWVGLLFLKMMVSGIHILEEPDLLRERHKFSNTKPQSYLLQPIGTAAAKSQFRDEREGNMKRRQQARQSIPIHCQSGRNETDHNKLRSQGLRQTWCAEVRGFRAHQGRCCHLDRHLLLQLYLPARIEGQKKGSDGTEIGIAKKLRSEKWNRHSSLLFLLRYSSFCLDRSRP
jgi:hypothetical protein